MAVAGGGTGSWPPTAFGGAKARQMRPDNRSPAPVAESRVRTTPGRGGTGRARDHPSQPPLPRRAMLTPPPRIQLGNLRRPGAIGGITMALQVYSGSDSRGPRA
jgi:hypothetical protein